MKTPLSLANAGEVKKYARHIILEYFKKRNPKSKEYQIKYGSADWEASFWPTDLMAWSSLSENFSNIKKKDVPGNNSINDILKKAISNALEAKELDPETFFDTKAFRKDDAVKRKRNRGIYEMPVITEETVTSSVLPEPSEGGGVFVPRRPTFNEGMEQTTIENQENEFGLDSAIYTDDMNDLLFETVFAEDCLHENMPNTNDNEIDSDGRSGVVPTESDIIVPSRPHLLEQLQGDCFFSLPNYLEKLASGMKIRYNSGGGICLTLVIAQFCNVDVVPLKRFANEFLIENWVWFKQTLTFPLELIIGTGEGSYLKIIKDQYEYFSFLRSEESLYSFNSGETEIILLATIIQQPIRVVHFVQQGFPQGTPLENRCDIKEYPFRLKAKTPYVQSKSPCLLYEDLVHFSLLVPKSTPDPNNPLEVESFVSNLVSSLFPGEEVANNNEEEHIQGSSASQSFCPTNQPTSVNLRALPACSPVLSAQETSSLPSAMPESSSKSESVSSVDITPPPQSDSSSTSIAYSEVSCRPKRKWKAKKIFDNSECARKSKRPISESVRKLLVKPSNSVERRDIEFQKQLKKRARETEQHEEEMERVQNNIKIMNDKKEED